MNPFRSAPRSESNSTRAPSDANDHESDALLAQALRNRDPLAAERLYSRYVRRVESLVRRRLGRDADLTDIVQEVFLIALASIDQLREPAALGSWVLGIAVGKARTHQRARWRGRWLEFMPDDLLPVAPPAHALTAEMLYDVGAILNSLRAEERSALLSHRLEEWSLEEAANAYGLSLTTFKRRFKRAELKFIAGARRRPALAPWLARESISRSNDSDLIDRLTSEAH